MKRLVGRALLARPTHPQASASKPRPKSAATLALLSLGLLASATVLLGAVTASNAVAAHHHAATWWLLPPFVIAFVIAEATQVHVEFRRETVSASLSELPLVLGLFVLPALNLVVARLIGAGVVFVIRRTPWNKSLFNLALFAAETAIAASLFDLAVPARSLRPRDMVVTFLCMATAELASTVAVLVAMAVLGGAISTSGIRRVLGSVALSGTLNTTLALVVLIVVRFDPAAAVLLAVLGTVTVIAYRAHSALLRKHNSLGQLYDLSRELSSASSEAATRAVLGDRCPAVMRAERVIFRAPSEAATDDLLGQLLRTGKPMILPRRSRSPKVRSWLAKRHLRDAVIVPLGGSQGLGGALQVENRLGEMSTFTVDDVRMLETITTHADAALRAGRSLAQLRHDARHDALTGLGNRIALFAEMDALLAAGGSGSVLLLDLDRFKEVNEALGHRIGDRLLGAVAARLGALLPPGVTLARLGGDEFAALLPGSGSAAAALTVAEALRVALKEPYEVEGTPLEVGASIGIAVVPEHGRDAITLLQHADVAMYSAKRAAAGVALYSSDDHGANLRRLTLSRELRRGVQSGEIVVHYQPKVALRTGELLGMEALARWQVPRRGLVMPDEFIPVAEQTGLIGALTEVVLRAALGQARRWLDGGRRVGVAVNLSGRGLHEPGLPRQVAEALRSSGVPADLLTLEITESSLILDFERAVGVLEELVALGVGLSLDDFGTGYSSLAYLQRLPVRELKIDKSFVWAMNTDASGPAIVQAVIDLAHILGLRVVAEGVEEEHVRRALAKMGCDAMQGYLLSRPMTAEATTEWLNRRTLRVPEQGGSRDAPRPRIVT